LFFAGGRALLDAAFARCLRGEAERLVKEAMARKTVAITQGNTASRRNAQSAARLNAG
jgi:hypothetical protein